MILGHTITEDFRKLLGILLKQPLKDKEKYTSKPSNSWWKLANNRGVVEAVFLEIEFEGAGKIKICIDKFNKKTVDWLRLIIESNGELAVSDTDIFTAGFTVSNVPIDIPLILLKNAKKM